jgi:hypothetical protein
MELSQAGHIYDHLVFRRVVRGVIFLGRANDQVDNAREAAAAATAFRHGMIDL